MVRIFLGDQRKCANVSSKVISVLLSVASFLSHYTRTVFRFTSYTIHTWWTGLSQSAVDCMVPEILVRRKQDKFLIQELEDLYPLESTVRVIAHPFKDGAGNARQNIFGLSREKLMSSNSSKLLIAIGPEGGWSSVEIDKFISKYSFQQVDMGNRILRTDVAITSVLALAHQLMQTIEVECGHH